MKKTLLAIASLLILTLGLPEQGTRAQTGFVVIVNAANPVSSISSRDLSRIFLRQSRRWDDGTNAEPVDLPTDNSVRGAFSEAVHGRSAASVSSFWRQQIFSGRSVPPPERDSEAAVVAFVASHRGGVGYVGPGTSTSRVKVVSVSR